MIALLVTAGVALAASSDPFDSAASPGSPLMGAVTVVKNRRLEHNETVAKALHNLGLDEPTVDAVQGALKANGFDFKRARPVSSTRSTTAAALSASG
jgi:hypothetical protein